MAEIKFNDNGTISVGIGTDTYSLKRPNLDQLFGFHDRISELTAQVSEQVQEAAKSDDTANELVGEMQSRRWFFENLIEPWLREVFSELGNKPLPEDLGDAPAEFAAPGLPQEILKFWLDSPLARSKMG